MKSTGTSSSSGSATRRSLGLNAGQQERVDLVEDHRQGDDQRRVRRVRERGVEGLGGAEGDRLDPVRQRMVHDPQDQVVLPGGEGPGRAEGERRR